MRAVVERVSEAWVEVADERCGAIGAGLLVYLGVAADDDDGDACYLAGKVRYLRVFSDADKPLHRDVSACGGEVLVVSAFTTVADARRGRRPSFAEAASPELAEPLYGRFCSALEEEGLTVRTGQFRAMMRVHSVNEGPICLLLDSRNRFQRTDSCP